MIAQTTRAPWRTAWRLGTSDGLLAVLLLGVAVGLAATVWLPQMPSASPAAYAQWLSETQARFGRATPTMQTMGLFAITRSFGFRLLLSLLAGCSLLRLVRAVDRLRQNREIAQPPAEGKWQTLSGPGHPGVTTYLRSRRYRVLDASPLLQADRWPWADSFTILTHTGSLLLLLGLLLFHLWGWEVTGWVVQAGNKVTLPGTGKWVSLDSHAREIAHSPGVVTFVEKRGPGVRLSAVDDAGNPLTLQQTVEAPPATQLTVALTEDQYLAVPDAQLIVRLTPRSDPVNVSHTAVLVQAYRSPPGRLITETAVEGDAELTVEGTTLELASVPYARLTVTFNPGLWPTGLSLVLVVVGLMGSILWPARRFWLREEGGEIVGTGDLPAALARERET